MGIRHAKIEALFLQISNDKDLFMGYIKQIMNVLHSCNGIIIVTLILSFGT